MTDPDISRDTSGNLTAQLGSFSAFLAIRGEDKFHEHLLDVLSVNGQEESPTVNAEDHGIKEKRYRPIMAYMFTRICTAGSYTKYDQSAMSLKESIRPWKNEEYNKDSRTDPGIYRWHKLYPLHGQVPQCASPKRKSDDPGVWESYYTLLGRYDVLSVVPTRPMSRSSIPQFGKEFGTQTKPPEQECPLEKYPSFFTRRELVIPIRLESGTWDCKNKRYEWDDIVAVISIALNRASARLDFVHRNLNIHMQNKTADEGQTNAGQSIKGAGKHNHIAKCLRPNDRAYLSDGWGDIILVLTGNPKKRLNDIFELQRILFEDFQVERTELMLTPQCIAEATLDSNYYVRVILRLMNNRTLAPDNEEFIGYIHSFEVEKSSPDFQLADPVLARIPGLSDYDIRFETIEDKDKARNLYKNILDRIVQTGRVDRFRTIIGFLQRTPVTFH